MKFSTQFRPLIGLIFTLTSMCMLASCASSGSSGASTETSQVQTTNSESQQTTEAPKAEQITRAKNGKTLIILPISFKAGINMHDAIRNECMLPQKLSGFIRDNAYSQYENIVVDENRSSSRADVLDIQIVNLRGPKGGGWSGPKYVSVQGTLKRRGRVVGNFQGKRTSMGGAFGVFKRTCDILGRCTKTLGADIATWLQNPAKNSSIGE